jgi:hypothetical protein
MSLLCALEFQNTKDETPKPCHKDNALNKNNNSNLFQLELGSNNKY